MKLEGSTAIVTGGASGLGEATVRRFVSEGANAVILDLNESRGNEIAEELGEAVRFAKADITNEEQVQAAVDCAVESFGGLHILVNCGGPMGPSHRTLARTGPMPLDMFQGFVEGYLTGTFNCIRLAAAAMAENEPNEDEERGVIINTSSVSAFEGQVGQANYAAAKAGVSGMTLVIARDLAFLGIRCNTIVPGLFQTPRIGDIAADVTDGLYKHMVFPKRPGRPDEFAQLAKAIIEIPVINGENIRIDQAMRMGPK